MPSQFSDELEGQTTRTDDLYEIMKSVLLWRDSIVGSATLPNSVDDIVYSPNKYRETEGIEEIKLKEL